MNFDLWRRWGIDLDDVSFANAWIALGLARPFYGFPSVKHLEAWPWNSSTLRWDFPSDHLADVGTPEQWAAAWKVVSDRIPKPIRLRVYPKQLDELILPWFQTLSAAVPAPDAISLSIDSPRAQLHIDWPLRLGCISENSWNVVELVMGMWPSKHVAQGVRLDRVTSNCDVLIERSSAGELLQALLEQPFGIKANIVVLQGGDEAVWGEIEALLYSILTLTRASGFILVPPQLKDPELATLINGLVEGLTHDNPVDVALGTNSSLSYWRGVVGGFTEEITTFAVHHLVDRYNARLEALPQGTELDMSKVGGPNEWLTKGVHGGGMRGGSARPVRRGARDSDFEADRHVMAKTVRIEEAELTFIHESEGSSTLADVSRAMATASVTAPQVKVRAARFLSQKSFVRVNSEYREAKKGFVMGLPAMVRVRIAAPEEGWDTLATEFPVEKLPQHLEKWTLTVWLTEPDHLAEHPLKRTIKLPRDGNSTECEFNFKPGPEPRFDGRITVLYRGRIIQTAVLRADVVSTIDMGVEEGAPKLEDLIAVRSRIADLDERRQFDRAFVANHDKKGRPLLTGLSHTAAWVKDLSNLVPVAAKINETLIPVAKSVADYKDGLNGDPGRELLIKLAKHGGWLKLYLDEQLTGTGNHPVTAKEDFLQIVSTRSDAVVPLEFVYEYQPPSKTATVCQHWLDAAKKGETLDKCPTTCDRTSGNNVCPMGFWGLQKVIERHAVTPGLAKDGNVLYLQSDPTRESDTLYLGGVSVLGSSKRVPAEDVTKLQDVITARAGKAPYVATNWDEWEKQVQEYRPNLLIALAHTDGKDSEVSLEIGGVEVETITLKDTHVFPPPPDGRQAPLVALIGCDTAGTASEYGHHVVCLRARGAGIVIGTIATVFGPHAAKVAEKLVSGLLAQAGAKPVRLGELIRTIRRESLREGLLMPLCLVAYGDADWIISSKGGPDV